MKKLLIIFTLLVTILSISSCGSKQREYDPNNFLATGDKIVK